ncbi:hypothetical protein ACH4TQ_06825 [Streptomyces sp. NPDC021218]|uniref:hypothetical protein n=1 Tax=Streptomyces sp. NPDC021218 TaxID=3365119 RepID=UPI0037B617EC
MTPELITAAALMAPGAILGPVCLAGHRRARRRDAIEAAVCAAYRPGPPDEGPEPPPKGRMKGKPQAAPARLARVIDFPANRRNAA